MNKQTKNKKRYKRSLAIAATAITLVPGFMQGTNAILGMTTQNVSQTVLAAEGRDVTTDVTARFDDATNMLVLTLPDGKAYKAGDQIRIVTRNRPSGTSIDGLYKGTEKVGTVSRASLLDSVNLPETKKVRGFIEEAARTGNAAKLTQEATHKVFDELSSANLDYEVVVTLTDAIEKYNTGRELFLSVPAGTSYQNISSTLEYVKRDDSLKLVYAARPLVDESYQRKSNVNKPGAILVNNKVVKDNIGGMEIIDLTVKRENTSGPEDTPEDFNLNASNVVATYPESDRQFITKIDGLGLEVRTYDYDALGGGLVVNKDSVLTKGSTIEYTLGEGSAFTFNTEGKQVGQVIENKNGSSVSIEAPRTRNYLKGDKVQVEVERPAADQANAPTGKWKILEITPTKVKVELIEDLPEGPGPEITKFADSTNVLAKIGYKTTPDYLHKADQDNQKLPLKLTGVLTTPSGDNDTKVLETVRYTPNPNLATGKFVAPPVTPEPTKPTPPAPTPAKPVTPKPTTPPVVEKTTKWLEAGTGKELKPSKTGKSEEPAGTITGYKFSNTVREGNVTKHIFVKTSNVTDLEDDLRLTTKWLEKGTNKELKPQFVAKGDNANYSEAGKITGYTFDSTVNNPLTKTRVHYFVKEKTPTPTNPNTSTDQAKKADLTTKWVDENGKDIKTPVKVEEGKGNYSEAGKVEGYIFDKTTTDEKTKTRTHKFVTEKTTKWLEDKTNKELKPSQKGKTPVTAGTITGYNFVGTKNQGNVTTHYFAKVVEGQKQAKIETRWVDESGKSLKDSVVGESAQPAGEIKGYKLVESKLEDKTSGDISKVQTHVFHKIQTIFVDENGKLVGPPVDGTVEPKEFPGYKLVGKSNDPNGDTRYTYHKIITSYKDEDGKDIIPPVEGEGGEKEFPGYKLVGKSNNPNGDTQYTYHKIVTSYKDENGKDIVPPKDGVHDPLELDGYKMIEKSVDPKNGDVSYKYHKIVTSYKDENGKDIVPPKDGVHDPLELDGYKMIEKSVDPKNGDVSYKYHKIITSYKDENGKDIVPPKDGVQKAIEIKGFEFKETVTDKNGDVTHRYKTKPNAPVATKTTPKQDIQTGVSVGKTVAPMLGLGTLLGGISFFAKKRKSK